MSTVISEERLFRVWTRAKLRMRSAKLRKVFVHSQSPFSNRESKLLNYKWNCSEYDWRSSIWKFQNPDCIANAPKIQLRNPNSRGQRTTTKVRSSRADSMLCFLELPTNTIQEIFLLLNDSVHQGSWNISISELHVVVLDVSCMLEICWGNNSLKIATHNRRLHKSIMRNLVCNAFVKQLNFSSEFICSLKDAE